MNIDKAIKLVQSQGNSIEKARLEAILWNKPPQEEVIEELARFQNLNGGFCYWVKQISNICDTIYILFWCDDLKLYHGPIVDSACKFLIDRQLRDGGWDEVNDVQKFNPPAWMKPGRIETRVWLTAYCAHALIRFGYAEAEGTSCPTNFLIENSDKKGRLTGYFRATWLVLPMFSLYPGIKSQAFQNALKILQSNYSPNWEGSYLAWLLRSLKDAGLNVDHPLVKRSLFDLKKKQRKDGSWEPEKGEGERHAINATIESLHAFKNYNII
ncbi:MAG: prenyltransferase/squalene oxidase repeat-containing protein [Promethearchaeota archaeon]